MKNWNRGRTAGCWATWVNSSPVKRAQSEQRDHQSHFADRHYQPFPVGIVEAPQINNGSYRCQGHAQGIPLLPRAIHRANRAPWPGPSMNTPTGETRQAPLGGTLIPPFRRQPNGQGVQQQMHDHQASDQEPLHPEPPSVNLSSRRLRFSITKPTIRRNRSNVGHSKDAAADKDRGIN